jgi:hypothetical protein
MQFFGGPVALADDFMELDFKIEIEKAGNLHRSSLRYFYRR